MSSAVPDTNEFKYSKIPPNQNTRKDKCLAYFKASAEETHQCLLLR